ncbi:CD180 antigen [Megalops cyprinoides]|uniref:CD180 antigen n=1 Tax=Megalops cyprinoides TaxID=118141 RepID=UPI001863B15C|nr:CD180 antigen [Megalops cyprinoides]
MSDRLSPGPNGLQMGQKNSRIDEGYDCSGHNFQNIPDELPSSTQILDFSFNYLPSIYNTTFGRFKSLVSLDLTRCRINWMFEDAFQSQNDLETLILNGNQLLFLAFSAFDGPRALKYLSLAQTSVSNLEFIPSRNLNFLETLEFGDNNIFSLQNLRSVIRPTMKSVNLQMNDIQNIAATDMSYLKYNTGIDLSFKGNGIVHIEPGAFDSFKLNSLDFSGCYDKVNISGILTGLRGLTTNILKLGVYEGTKKVYTTTKSLQGLCYIDVKEVSLQLHHFPDLNNATFKCFNGVQRLHLTRAHLSYLPSNITNMGSLTHISLDENSFQDVCHINAHNFPSLSHLSMKRNKNKLWFQESCLKGLSKLEFLDLSESNLQTGSQCCSKQLEGLGNLRYLKLSRNPHMQWESLPFGRTPQLNLLDCAHLSFSHSSDEGPFRNLLQLQTLNLSWSKVNLSDVELLQGLPSLRHLTLSGNYFHLGVISDTETFKHIPLLETLILSECGITAMKDNVFQVLTNLVYVDLSGNKLVTFRSGPFYSLEHIQLNFARNEIEIVDGESFKGLGTGSKIDLRYNPLACNCSNIQFIQWAQENADKIMRPKATVCGDSKKEILDVQLRCEG